MGFLKQHLAVESWLAATASQFRPLSQAEYADVVREWRSHFDESLGARHFSAGSAAEEAMLQMLPCDAFVFSIPGYHSLPASTDPRFDPAYGYEVIGLRDLDFAVANRADAVISDRRFSFTCLCTHEAGAFAEPQFCEAR
jgi:hypothetical protein